jgi:hypothetical protein
MPSRRLACSRLLECLLEVEVHDTRRGKARQGALIRQKQVDVWYARPTTAYLERFYVCVRHYFGSHAMPEWRIAYFILRIYRPSYKGDCNTHDSRHKYDHSEHEYDFPLEYCGRKYFCVHGACVWYDKLHKKMCVRMLIEPNMLERNENWGAHFLGKKEMIVYFVVEIAFSPWCFPKRYPN